MLFLELMLHSIRSRDRGSRIPPRTGPFCSWGLKLAHVGSFCALLSLLGRVLLVSGGSSSPVCHFFTFRDAPASILAGSGTVWGGFWRLRHLIFRCFLVHVGLTCVNAPTLTKRWQEQQKSRFLIYRKPHAQAKKRRKIVPGAF